MTDKSPAELRLDLARGHWSLGERDDAIFCLERCAEAAPDFAPLRDLALGFLGELTDDVDDLLAERLRALCAALPADAQEESPPPAVITTPTFAQVLAGQGHTERALEVADAVLARSPDDERALAVREELAADVPDVGELPRYALIRQLEAWLANARRRRAELETA
jgi:tetratricopeptide (TPR) repeat protein